MTYQPTATSPGERACIDRYEVIRQVVSAIPEPFSVLDLGANAGWFSARLTADFDCHVTAVDDHRDLPAIDSDRVTVVNRRVTAVDLRRMPRVDVVLALSVLHHMPDWRQVLDQVTACRGAALIEVPDPAERWMRSSAARHELGAIHKTVSALGECLATSERTGRDGRTYERPLVGVMGRLRWFTATVFSGSGTCSRKLGSGHHTRGLDRELGYQPYPGSLNLRCDRPVDLGPPWLGWPGIPKRRPYWFWPAWLDGKPVHAMDPAGRGHGPGCIEVVAPYRLRDRHGYADGDTVTLEVACG